MPSKANPSTWRQEPAMMRYKGGTLYFPARVLAIMELTGMAAVNGINLIPASSPEVP